MTLDQHDRFILKALQKDSSISNLDLSKQVGLSPSACLARTKSLKEAGIIRQFTAIVDESQIGLGLTAFITVSLSPLKREVVDEFMRHIEAIPQVLECYTIAGTRDYLLKVVTRDMQSYKDFVLDSLMVIPAIKQIEAHIVINTDKRTFVLPIEE